MCHGNNSTQNPWKNLRFHSPLLCSMGVLSVPLGPETSSTSGIGIAFSVKKKKK